MEEFITVTREEEHEVKTGIFRTSWLTHVVKISIRIDEIIAWTDYRVYLKNKTSFSCDQDHETITRFIAEAKAKTKNLK